MRVAMVSDAIYPYHKGGKETRLFELSKRLVRAGHDVHIYTMNWWGGERVQRTDEGVTLHAIMPQMNLYHGDRRSIAQGVAFGFATLRLTRARFDIADVDHMPYFPLFGMWLVCKLKRRPLVATWHEVWGRDYWHEYLGALGSIAAVLELISARLPDRIAAVSPETAKRLVEELHVKQPVSDVVNGIDAAYADALKPAADTSDIVYVGRLLAHKHVDELIRAVAWLAPERPDLRCLIISDGPERAKLEQLAASLGVRENVVFTGFVSSDQEKLRLMKASKVFVLPSTREGFGISALEAMACGLPVVTVDHPDNATRHLITPETGIVCELSAPAIALAIARLLDPKRRPNPAQEARRYDWNESARALEKVYAL